MTMYESENDLCGGTPSTVEPDCFYSVSQSLQTQTAMNSRKSYSDHGEFVTADTVTYSQPVCTSLLSSVTMTNGIERDEEMDVNSICEQLDSFDMIDDECRRGRCESQPRPINGCKNGAQKHTPDFQEVYVQDTDGDTMLHMAIIHLKVALALQFIDISPSCTWLNLRNHMYQTALHLAAITQQLPIIRRLIVGGADIESRDRNGNTPLHIACRDGFLEGVRVLLEPVRYVETKQNSYDIPYQRIPQNLEITNYEGLTALHLAATNGHLDIVKLLIEKHADVNGRDIKNGQSILHKACSDGNLQLVRFLLKCRECDINLKTYDDFTPFDFARARSYERITFELAVAGAKYDNENEEYD